jgi:energy-coupling factor transporter ATP-binding protein EcfA2
MIKTFRITSEFSAVPYLPGSSIIANHRDGICFSTEKPNVIIGKNGSGKSALLKTLSLLTLTYLTGESTFDSKIYRGRNADQHWTRVGYRYGNDFLYLHGLECEHDKAASVYYRPGHIPGNETSVGNALVTGYFDEAKAYARATEKKSSGEKCLVMLEKVNGLIDGTAGQLAYQYLNWGRGTAPIKLDSDAGEYEHKAEILKALYGDIPANGIPALLGDEPEQSLDALEQALFWKRVERADPKRVQVIVASHSLYPILNPDAFNLIEATPGFANMVRSTIAR